LGFAGFMTLIIAFNYSLECRPIKACLRANPVDAMRIELREFKIGKLKIYVRPTTSKFPSESLEKNKDLLRDQYSGLSFSFICGMLIMLHV